jgi:hypothetical protein
MKCANCKTLLKKKYGNTFWTALAIAVISYLFAYLLFSPIGRKVVNLSVLPAWFFIGLLVYLLVVIFAVPYIAIFFVEFESVSEENL